MSNLILFDNVLQPMTADEADASLDHIRTNQASTRYEILALYERDGWKAKGFSSWKDFAEKVLATVFNFDQSYIHRLKDAAVIERNITELPIGNSVIPETQLRPIAQAKLQPAQQKEVWAVAVKTAPGGKVTAAHVAQTVSEYRQVHPPQAPEPARDYAPPVVISVNQWQALSAAEQAVALTYPSDKSGFNQTNDNIEWAAWSWNPVTGCLHNCAYCYARDIAQRFYTKLPEADRFTPVFHPDRLRAPTTTSAPDLSQVKDPVRRLALRNVFVCSMADLFGKWVPTAWIEAVLQQARDNPQWNFLFLTKFPIRMAEFEYPPNTWIGTTVDTQAAVERAEKAFRKVRATGYQGVAWLSVEPMMEKLTFASLEMFDWVVMGGASASTQTPEFRPPFDWIVHLWLQAKALNLPVYMKTNLGFDDASKGDEISNRVREYPQQR